MHKCESGKLSYATIVLSNAMELTVKTMVMALCNRKGWIAFFPMVSNTSASVAGWSKQTSERCEQTSERTSEWFSTYVSILVCSRP